MIVETIKTIYESTEPYKLSINNPYLLAITSPSLPSGTTIYFVSPSSKTAGITTYYFSDEESKYILINKILDMDAEQYLVSPDSNTLAKDWKGWCWDKTLSGTTFYLNCK